MSFEILKPDINFSVMKVLDVILQNKIASSTLLFNVEFKMSENGNPLQCFCLKNPMDGGAW